MSMQTTDPIADLLTRIRNAKLVGKTEVRVPSSRSEERRVGKECRTREGSEIRNKN